VGLEGAKEVGWPRILRPGGNACVFREALYGPVETNLVLWVAS
jgi:hypothetical protein